MRFRFIEDRRADYPVTILCDVLGVSPCRLLRLALPPGEPAIRRQSSPH
jgi:hypothetical protein